MWIERAGWRGWVGVVGWMGGRKWYGEGFGEA